MVTEADTERRVEAVRRFNRFYTKRIGVLREGLLQSAFSLTERACSSSWHTPRRRPRPRWPGSWDWTPAT